MTGKHHHENLREAGWIFKKSKYLRRKNECEFEPYSVTGQLPVKQ
jgi:hypothetical protein